MTTMTQAKMTELLRAAHRRNTMTDEERAAERAYIARTAPCDRGIPRPTEPELPSSLSADEHNRRIIAYQAALDRWHGA
jgi:hypothetical protein